MRESIVISHTQFADPADVAGFVDVLRATLSEEGAVASILAQQVDPYLLNGNQFRVMWSGTFGFSSPDKYFEYEEQMGSVEIEAERLNFSVMMALLGRRNRKMAQAYRSALFGIYNLSNDLKDGRHKPEGMTGEEYLSATLESAIDAFPNSQ